MPKALKQTLPANTSSGENNSSQAKKNSKSTTGKHTTPSQYRAMVDWLETDNNFKWITGALAQSSSMTSNQNFKKIAAADCLAEYVNAQERFDKEKRWDAKTAKDRYDRYVKKYKAAQLASEGTGFGVTDMDLKKGISTLEEKLDSLCPWYDRMDNLFGHRQNIAPSHVLATSPPKLATQMLNQGQRQSTAEEETSSLGSIDDLAEENEDSSQILQQAVNNDARDIVSLEDAQNLQKQKKRKVSDAPPSSLIKKEKTSDMIANWSESFADRVEMQRQQMEFQREFQDREVALKQEELDIKRKQFELQVQDRKENMIFEHKKQKWALYADMLKKGLSPSEAKEAVKEFDNL